MLDRARQNLRKAGLNNVEFRLGEIEHLPVADSSVDVIISNCVINLAPARTAGAAVEEIADAVRSIRVSAVKPV